MSTENWAMMILGGILLISVVALVNHRVEQSRLERMRTLTTATLFFQTCWALLQRVPDSYLPNSVRHALGKAMRHRAAQALSIDPGNATMEGYSARASQFAANRNQIAHKDVLNAHERKAVRQALTGIKRIVLQAGISRTISQEEVKQAESILDTLIARLLIDHLKHTAMSAENLRNYSEAINLFSRAHAELGRITAQDVSAEAAEIERHIGDLKRLRDTDTPLAAATAREQAGDILKQADDA